MYSTRDFTRLYIHIYTKRNAFSVAIWNLKDKMIGKNTFSETKVSVYISLHSTDRIWWRLAMQRTYLWTLKRQNNVRDWSQELSIKNSVSPIPLTYNGSNQTLSLDDRVSLLSLDYSHVLNLQMRSIVVLIRVCIWNENNCQYRTKATMWQMKKYWRDCLLLWHSVSDILAN